MCEEVICARKEKTEKVNQRKKHQENRLWW